MGAARGRALLSAPTRVLASSTVFLSRVSVNRRDLFILSLWCADARVTELDGFQGGYERNAGVWYEASDPHTAASSLADDQTYKNATGALRMVALSSTVVGEGSEDLSGPARLLCQRVDPSANVEVPGAAGRVGLSWSVGAVVLLAAMSLL